MQQYIDMDPMFQELIFRFTVKELCVRDFKCHQILWIDFHANQTHKK